MAHFVNFGRRKFAFHANERPSAPIRRKIPLSEKLAGSTEPAAPQRSLWTTEVHCADGEPRRAPINERRAAAFGRAAALGCAAALDGAKTAPLANRMRSGLWLHDPGGCVLCADLVAR